MCQSPSVALKISPALYPLSPSFRDTLSLSFPAIIFSLFPSTERRAPFVVDTELIFTVSCVLRAYTEYEIDDIIARELYDMT